MNTNTTGSPSPSVPSGFGPPAYRYATAMLASPTASIGQPTCATMTSPATTP